MNETATPTTVQAAPVEDEQARSLLADLLESSKLYHTTEDYQALLAFVSKLRNFAPFNAMLLHIQKPGLAYAASAYDWATRFGRSIKEDARPLLILWPFGPVALVYDLQDTDGPPLPEDVAETFHATGPMTEGLINKYMARLASKGIYAKHMDSGDAHAGFIKLKPSDDQKLKPDYQLRINRNHSLATQFVTLAHELAHLYLGHLGADAYLKVTDRSRLKHSATELEAESVAYLVSHRRGISAKSQSYLAGYVSAGTSLADLDLYHLTKAAGQIEDVLGIAAHTLFAPQPRAKRKRRQTSQPAPKPAPQSA
jgi:hypothetical protein